MVLQNTQIPEWGPCAKMHSSQADTFSRKSLNLASDGCKDPKLQEEVSFLLPKHLII